jgi:hypothetical protein
MEELRKRVEVSRPVSGIHPAVAGEWIHEQEKVLNVDPIIFYLPVFRSVSKNGQNGHESGLASFLVAIEYRRTFRWAPWA